MTLDMDVNVLAPVLSCLTLCDPMDCSPPGSSVLRIFTLCSFYLGQSQVFFFSLLSNR